MASGFLILSDGRCLARHWSAHDGVLRKIAENLGGEPSAQALRGWLLSQLPGPSDKEELGYGAWFRTADRKVIAKQIDLRQMTTENQMLFCEAAKRANIAASQEQESIYGLKQYLSDLADMIARCERGEPPLSKSDWTAVVPPSSGPIGPHAVMPHESTGR